MITCENCGTAMPDAAVICPSCGSTTSFARSSQTPPSQYEQSSYNQGYGSSQSYNPQSGPIYSPQPGPGYAPQPNPGYAPQPGYGVPYNAPQMMYAPQPQVAINVNMASAAPVASSGNSGAVVAEVLLNIFLGIYGVGWLMAGETTVGIILLICSIVLYWPIVVLVSIFTFGLGLFCFGPLAIGGLILNAILLNNTIKRKTTMVVVQPMGYPPR